MARKKTEGSIYGKVTKVTDYNFRLIQPIGDATTTHVIYFDERYKNYVKAINGQHIQIWVHKLDNGIMRLLSGSKNKYVKHVIESRTARIKANMERIRINQDSGQVSAKGRSSKTKSTNALIRARKPLTKPIKSDAKDVFDVFDKSFFEDA